MAVPPPSTITYGQSRFKPITVGAKTYKLTTLGEIILGALPISYGVAAAGTKLVLGRVFQVAVGASVAEAIEGAGAAHIANYLSGGRFGTLVETIVSPLVTIEHADRGLAGGELDPSQRITDGLKNIADLDGATPVPQSVGGRGSVGADPV